ncbi:hypothetical protein BV25DRAFT_205432 [Artomyces pyxidatus]|uniref:Uncharacterized protein n=1 Tax=Artomyces pyxidatus TaxID=48021 RepID=A0ACB8T8M6_9AGAM|nr:hypothetical protein BV25DRAFT_205432 [Artomyces pyxidatus]
MYARSSNPVHTAVETCHFPTFRIRGARPQLLRPVSPSDASVCRSLSSAQGQTVALRQTSPTFSRVYAAGYSIVPSLAALFFTMSGPSLTEDGKRSLLVLLHLLISHSAAHQFHTLTVQERLGYRTVGLHRRCFRPMVCQLCNAGIFENSRRCRQPVHSSCPGSYVPVAGIVTGRRALSRQALLPINRLRT